MKIFEKFGDKNFHSSLITTFGIDFDTYEHIVLPRLRGSGCRNNILVTDSRMLTYALDSTSFLPRSAGRHYTVTGVSTKGVFHPKIVLQLGRNAGRLIISSANMTSSGIAGNLEIAGQIDCSSIKSGERSLIIQAWNYLCRIVEPNQAAISHQLNWIRARCRWLADVEPMPGSIELSDGTLAAFLVNAGNNRIGDDYISLVGDDPVNRLIVISPYWDTDLAALKSLVTRLKVKEVFIVIDINKSLFPKDALSDLPDVKVVDISKFKFAKDRFVHAKAIIAQTKQYEHVLYGSANCTIAALGGDGFGGFNDEASLYRRFPIHTAISNLELKQFLNESQTVSHSLIPNYHRGEEIPLEQSAIRTPGKFECIYDTFCWWPPKTLKVEGCSIELLGLHGEPLDWTISSFVTGDHGQQRAKITRGNLRPSFACIRYPNGDISARAIVTLVDIIRDDVRETRGKKAEDAALQLAEETEEGLWLLEVLNIIEASETERSIDSIRESGVSVANRQESSNGFKTLSYDQFMARRSAVFEDSGVKRLGLSGSETSLVRSFLNRILNLKDDNVAIDDAKEQQQAQSLLNMRDETGATQGIESEDYSTIDIGITEQKALEQKQKIAAGRIEATREQIVHSVEKFNERIRAKVKDGEISMIDVLRLRAIITVVASAGWCEYEKVGVQKRTSIQVLPSYGDYSWLKLIGQLLFTFFGGPSPAIRYLQLNTEHDQIPHDVFEALITCIWAANACIASASNYESLSANVPHFQKRVNEVYLQTKLSPQELGAGWVINMMIALNHRFDVRLGISGEMLMQQHQTKLSVL